MIKVECLSKTFEEKKVVDSLNINVNKGTIFGLLGPNGAGKTTTFRMLTTLLKPDSGKIHINNKEMNRSRLDIKKEIGMVSQHFSLQSEMTICEVLELHGMLHNMNKRKRSIRIEELLKFSGLYEDRNKLTNKLSGGMKRKLMIIRAIMHNPQILFLDEPTVGLDPYSRRNIWDLLKKLRSEDLTIILTTHYIEEAEILCNKIVLLDYGKKIDEGSPKQLVSKIGKFTVEVFNKDKTTYKYFNKREDAINYANNTNGQVIVRKSNLEDMFIKLTSHKVEN